MVFLHSYQCNKKKITCWFEQMKIFSWKKDFMSERSERVKSFFHSKINFIHVRATVQYPLFIIWLDKNELFFLHPMFLGTVVVMQHLLNTGSCSCSYCQNWCSCVCMERWDRRGVPLVYHANIGVPWWSTTQHDSWWWWWFDNPCSWEISRIYG